MLFRSVAQVDSACEFTADKAGCAVEPFHGILFLLLVSLDTDPDLTGLEIRGHLYLQNAGHGADPGVLDPAAYNLSQYAVYFIVDFSVFYTVFSHISSIVFSINYLLTRLSF